MLPTSGRANVCGTLEEKQILFALLCYCLPWAQAAAAASEIMGRFGSFAEAISVPQDDLTTLPSVPQTAASLLKCVQAAAARLAVVEVRDAVLLNRWDRLETYLRSVMARDPRESLRVLFLDAKNRLLADEVMGVGDVRGVAVHPRQIVKRALELHATALILAHNHPSGDPTPSPEDVRMTGEVQRAAAALGIQLHDHIVVGRAGCVSLRRMALLDDAVAA
ncbi:MAG: DNA repair protein RadC [Acetobacteraceae bacterium]|nr:DNA repair protein RadC [Acetobacteraceae bacterium]